MNDLAAAWPSLLLFAIAMPLLLRQKTAGVIFLLAGVISVIGISLQSGPMPTLWVGSLFAAPLLATALLKMGRRDLQTTLLLIASSTAIGALGMLAAY